VDELLAELLNEDALELLEYSSIQRLGIGKYVFGSTKIFLRIVNGKLIGKKKFTCS
jgi:hypothetical protein